MARVPYVGYDPDAVKPDGAPSGDYQQISTDPAKFGGLIGQAAQRAGQDISRGAEDLTGALIMRKEQTNELYANDASTDGMQKLASIWGQYNTLQGRAAHDAWPQYQQDMKKAYDDSVAAAPNQDAKVMLAKSMKFMTDRYLSSGQEYADTQWKQWYNNSASQRANELANQAVIARQDPKGFDQFVHAGLDEVMKPLDAAGADQGQRDAASRAFIGTTVKNAADSFVLDGKLPDAVNLLSRYGSQMDAKSRIDIERTLAPKIKETNAQAAADWAANPTGPKPDMITMPQISAQDSSAMGGASTDSGPVSRAPVMVPSAQIGASISKAASELGTSPQDLATVISYESAGTFSTSKWGGKGGNYMGLIQFGPEERAQYGARPGQSFDEQMGAVVRYLKDRGFKPGMNLLDLYSTINAGSPGHYNANDGNGTVREHVARMQGANMARAQSVVNGDAEPININAGATHGAAPGAITSADLPPAGATPVSSPQGAPVQMASNGVIDASMAATEAASGVDQTKPQAPVTDTDAAQETNDESAAVRRVLDVTAGDPDTQRAALAKLKQNFSTQRAATATDRQALEQSIPDLMAATEAGVQNVPWPDDNKIRTLLPAAKANSIIEERDIAQRSGEIVRGLRWSSTQDWENAGKDILSGQGLLSTMMKAHAKTGAVGAGAMGATPDDADVNARYFRLQRTIGTQFQQQYAARQQALANDPAAYVADNPRVQELFNAIKPDDPKTYEAWATASQGVQTYLGVPQGQQHLLTSTQAQQLAGKLMEPGVDSHAMLNALQSKYGAAFQPIFKDFVTLGKLPAAYQSVQALDNDHDANLLARAINETKPGADGKPKDWNEILGNAGGKPVATTIRDSVFNDTNVQQFRQSLVKSGASLGQATDITNSIVTLAYAKSFYEGTDPATAAASAVQSFTGKYEYMPGGARVPSEAYDAVAANAGDTLKNLSSDQIKVPPIFGQQGMPSRDEYMNTLKANPSWITSPQGNALWLMDQQGKVVRTQDGKPVQVPFAQPAPASKTPAGAAFDTSSMPGL